MENRPRILILGYARHGKDTVAEMLRDNYGLKFISSSEFCGREALWDQWGKAVYPSFEAMFEDRVNHRELWMQMISAYNTPDKTKTASTMFERGYDMYVGMRRQDELDACRVQGLFDIVLWVDRSGSEDIETGSMDITCESSRFDYMICNNGDLNDLAKEVAKAVLFIREQGYDWRLPNIAKKEFQRIYKPEPRQIVAEVPQALMPQAESAQVETVLKQVDLLSVPEYATKVLDHGYVMLVDTMGTDDDIAEAARLSYGRGTKKTRDNSGLIRYLYSHHHTSPFEMVEMKFQMRLPIFVMRQWVRHRTANLNEYSGRYSVMPKLWYVPELDMIKGQDTTNRQASSGELSQNTRMQVQQLIDSAATQAFTDYETLLELGVSREMARIILPLNMYTEIVWKMDLNNMLKFLWLRDDGHAQPEIQAFARVIAGYVEQSFPKTYAAYVESRQSINLTMPELYALLTGDRSKLSKSQTKASEEMQRQLQQWITAEIAKAE